MTAAWQWCFSISACLCKTSPWIPGIFSEIILGLVWKISFTRTGLGENLEEGCPMELLISLDHNHDRSADSALSAVTSIPFPLRGSRVGPGCYLWRDTDLKSQQFEEPARSKMLLLIIGVLFYYCQLLNALSDFFIMQVSRWNCQLNCCCWVVWNYLNAICSLSLLILFWGRCCTVY
jgi:hypothetical protein